MRSRFGRPAVLLALFAGACASPRSGERGVGPDYSVLAAGYHQIDRAAVLPFDAQPAKYTWHDPVLDCRVESDFPPGPISTQLEDFVGPRLALFCRWFGVRDTSGLCIRLYERDPLVKGDYLVNGFHHAEEVHVFAGRSASDPGSLDARSLRTLVHELAHACIYLADLSYPRWLEEAICEVLSRVQIDVSGRYTLPADLTSERYVRCLFDDGEQFEIAELLSYRQGYPEPHRMQAFYAQASSFVGFLLRERESDLGRELLGLTRTDEPALLRAGERWERAMRSL